jgi:hypothetical protein
VYNNAIQLQHESYRDGIIGSGQAGETVQAVIAHTMMADRMRNVGADFEKTAGLARDLAAWDKAASSGNMSGFALYAMSNYDFSADYWKLTDDGKLIYDGKATVLDAETGEVLVSLADLGLSDDNDYTGALAKMFNIDRVKAGEIVNTMTTVGNESYIQLGNNTVIRDGSNDEKIISNGGLEAEDFINALKYGLTNETAYSKANANRISFYVLPQDEQMDYLKSKVVIGGALSGMEKGKTASDLRSIRNFMRLGGLFENDKDFMNENLRDFMNLQKDGTMNYLFNELTILNGWIELPSIAAQYHQSTADIATGLYAKFVNLDGREVVVNKDRELVLSYPDRGTYNFANATPFNSFAINNEIYIGRHALYDIKPFDELIGNVSKKYYPLPWSILLRNSSYWR